MKRTWQLLLFLMPLLVTSQAKQWSLEDCINYAVQHNISVKKNGTKSANS